MLHSILAFVFSDSTKDGPYSILSCIWNPPNVSRTENSHHVFVADTHSRSEPEGEVAEGCHDFFFFFFFTEPGLLYILKSPDQPFIALRQPPFERCLISPSLPCFLAPHSSTPMQHVEINPLTLSSLGHSVTHHTYKVHHINFLCI